MDAELIDVLLSRVFHTVARHDEAAPVEEGRCGDHGATTERSSGGELTSPLANALMTGILQAAKSIGGHDAPRRRLMPPLRCWSPVTDKENVVAAVGAASLPRRRVPFAEQLSRSIPQSLRRGLDAPSCCIPMPPEQPVVAATSLTAGGSGGVGGPRQTALSAARERARRDQNNSSDSPALVSTPPSSPLPLAENNNGNGSQRMYLMKRSSPPLPAGTAAATETCLVPAAHELPSRSASRGPVGSSSEPSADATVPPLSMPVSRPNGIGANVLAQHYIEKLNATLQQLDSEREAHRRACAVLSQKLAQAEADRDQRRSEWLASQTSLAEAHRSAREAIEHATKTDMENRRLNELLEDLRIRDHRNETELNNMKKVYVDAGHKKEAALSAKIVRLGEQLAVSERNEHALREALEAEQRRAARESEENSVVWQKQVQSEVQRRREMNEKMKASTAEIDRLRAVIVRLEASHDATTASPPQAIVPETSSHAGGSEGDDQGKAAGSAALVQHVLEEVQNNAAFLFRRCCDGLLDDEARRRTVLAHHERAQWITMRGFMELEVLENDCGLF